MSNTAKTYNFENMEINQLGKDALRNIISDKLFLCNVSTEHAAQITESIVRYGIRNQKAIIDSLKVIAPEFEIVSDRIFNYLDRIVEYNQSNLQQVFNMDIETAKEMSEILNNNIKTQGEEIRKTIDTVGKYALGVTKVVAISAFGIAIAKNAPAIAKSLPKIIKVVKM